jgi:diguanylate cyclase (GGDEF)-like protein
MKKEILIYEKDKENLKFLEAFFKGRSAYSARFIESGKRAFKKELLERKPSALIISSPHGLKQIRPLEVRCPIIALISGNVTEGIRCVVKSDIEYYLMSPFYTEDLEHKLKLAIDRKRWFANLFKEKKDLDALIEFTYFVSSTLNPKDILYILVKKISEMMNVSRCSVISLDLKEKRYAYIVSTSEDPDVTKLKIDLQKYPELKKAIALKNPVIIKDALNDPIMKNVKDTPALSDARSILILPVIFRDEVIGTLLLRTIRSDRPFTQREIKLCASIANTSANAFYNAFLYDRLEREKKKFEKLAIHDYLTGIYNIRYFYNRLDEEFSRVVRYNNSLCCMMIDIDFFKKINDTYGHRVGDIVLREFAQLVRGLTRKSDIFARYGGEEFIVLLPQTDLKGAMDKAKKIRKVVREYTFMGLDEEYTVTVSIGISRAPDKRIHTPDELISVADTALFRAKNKGRDQVVVS